ncbi:MAG: SDR family oxidoreductase [Gammaproteobacteria bacterium]
MVNSLKDKKIVVIGGSSGIGFETAKLFAESGSNVVIGGRDQAKLNRKKIELRGNVEAFSIDIMNLDSVQFFFERVGKFDHLHIPASNMKTGSLKDFEIALARQSFDSKFWGPYQVAKIALSYLSDVGSMTFFSGAYSQRPIASGAAIGSAINSAIEGLVRALAVELAPIRVNAISPGLTMTERFTENYSPEALKALTENFSEHLLIKRPAESTEVALAAKYLTECSYVTGTTLFVDGGLSLH